MQQLKMYLLPEIAVTVPELPEGYSFSTCKTEEDIPGWVECCRDGQLINDADGFTSYKETILDRKEILPARDVFFLDHEGEHVATATCYINDKNEGDLHMVGMRTDHRGKGLAKYIVAKALENLNGKKVKMIHLTTDEFRENAIRGYLDAGFLPVNYDADMQERWEQVLYDLGRKCTLMLNDDISVKGVIYGKNHRA